MSNYYCVSYCVIISSINMLVDDLIKVSSKMYRLDMKMGCLHKLFSSTTVIPPQSSLAASTSVHCHQIVEFTKQPNNGRQENKDIIDFSRHHVKTTEHQRRKHHITEGLTWTTNTTAQQWLGLLRGKKQQNCPCICLCISTIVP